MSPDNTPPKTKQTAFENVKVVGGDLSVESITQIGQQVVTQKLDFFEPILEQYKPPKFGSPKIASDLVEIIKQQRLLVLGDSPEVDTAELARHLSWYLSNERSASGNQPLVVKEWYRNSDPQSIDVELQKTEKSTVFILTQVSPQNIIGYDLPKFKKIAASRQHYVIVTTDTPFAAWKLPNESANFWRELSAKDVADSRNLVSQFTPENNISDWYYKKLSPREQLLALGLSFFDGLFDDQFFAALEEVVEHVWQRRDPSLRALDYCDFDKLRNFFNFTETKQKRTLVEVRFPKERQMLLKVVWGSHRRQILAALPVLVNLARNSAIRFERELYGSRVRREQLRKVLSETISDIGLISSDAVEDALLNIAADENIYVQAVAAQAMALWRDDESRNERIDRQLFETLQRWQNEARALSFVDAILKNRDQRESKEPTDYIRATIALTVGYAALYDSPNQLAPELCELVKTLVSEENKLVRDRVFKSTLPKVILRHILQFRSILHDMLRNFDGEFVSAVASSLAYTYPFRPNDVLDTLKLWKEECKSTRTEKVNIAKVTSREALLATVALTYGEIECVPDIGDLTPEQAVGYLQTILVEELHPRIREAALFAIGRQAYRNFEKVEPQLQDLVPKLKPEERQKVAAYLTEIYLEQRAKLPQGENYIKVNDREYPVWLNSTRPSTPVEKAMLEWAKNDQNAMAQQVVLDASANFVSKFEREEERQIEQLRKGRAPLETKPVYADPIVGGQPPQGWYLGTIIPWLVTRNAGNYRISIRNLLPEGLRQRQLNREVMNFVLRKWGDASDNDVKTISGQLKLGLWLAENLGWLAALGIGSSLTLVGIAAINLSKYPTSTVPSKPMPIAPSITISNRAIVSDVDSPTFNTGKLTVRFSPDGTSDDRLGIHNQGKDSGQIGVSGSEVSYGGTVIGLFDGGKGSEPLVIDLNSNATLPAVQALMRNITYHNLASSPNLGSRKVEFLVTDDGGAPSPKPVTRNIFVISENTAPTIIVPEGQAVNENEPLKISGISIDDPDSTRNFTITFSVSNGTITVKDSVPKGLTGDSIIGNNTKTVKLVGSAKKIKETLADPAAVIYKGTNDDTVSITVNDGGEDIPADAEGPLVWPPNAQDAKTSRKEIKIAVNPANKPPILTLSESNKTVNEDENLTIGGISIDDPDSSNITVYLIVQQGTLTIKNNVAKGLTANEISGNKTRYVSLTGALAKIKATLADPKAITYRGNQDFNGTDDLTINIDDGGRGRTDKLRITVNPVNDPPILGVSAAVDTPQPPQQTAKDSPNSTLTNAIIVGEPGEKNIRSGPGTEYPPRHVAYPGDRIQIIDKAYDREIYLWYKVYFPQSGAEGWIAGQLVKIDDNVPSNR